MKCLRYHMMLQGMSNLLNTTVVVKAKALGFASQAIMEQTSHEGDTHLAYILQSSSHNEVVFEAHTTQFDNGLFQETGRILFGGDQHVLHISTLGTGQLLVSPNPKYQQGAVAFQINGGTGIFDNATGIITTNFLVGELGDYRDAHTATIFLHGKVQDSVAEEIRLLVRNVLDEKAFPVMIDSSFDFLGKMTFRSLLKIDPNPYSKTHVNPLIWSKAFANITDPINIYERGLGGSGTPIIRTLIAHLKLVLREGLLAFEQHEDRVVERGSTQLVEALKKIPNIIEHYYTALNNE